MTGFRALAVQNRYLAMRCQVHSLRAPAELNERNLAGAWRLPRMTRYTAGEWSDRSGMRGAHDAISSALSKYRSRKDDTKIEYPTFFIIPWRAPPRGRHLRSLVSP